MPSKTSRHWTLSWGFFPLMKVFQAFSVALGIVLYPLSAPSGGLSRADNAATTPLSLYVGHLQVVPTQRVPMLAVGFEAVARDRPPLARLVLHVVGWSAEKQVGRIDTRGIVAVVANKYIGRDWSEMDLPCDAVCAMSHTIYLDSPVTIGSDPVAHPQMAPRSSHDSLRRQAAFSIAIGHGVDTNPYPMARQEGV